MSLSIFSYQLGWTPPGGDLRRLHREPRSSGPTACSCRGSRLALLFSAQYARLTRAGMLETMGEDYIRTARAKGLKERKVVVKHGLRAALTPIVTIFGLDFGLLIGGAVLTETVFGLPGLGALAIDGTKNNDLPQVLARGADHRRLRRRLQPGRRPALRRHRPESASEVTIHQTAPHGAPAAGGAPPPRGRGPPGALLHRRRPGQVRRRAVLPPRAGPDPRHRGGVGLGQVGDEHGRDGPAHRQERPHLRLDPARRPGAGRSRQRRRARAARQEDGDDLPGPAVGDAPLLHGRQPDHRGLPDPQQGLQEGRPPARHRHARPGRDPRARPAGGRLPAPVLRRHAAARDDRDVALLRPRPADRRRADHRARRDRAGADPRPDPRPAEGVQLRGRDHHPRPRRGRRARRRHPGDVRRPRGGVRHRRGGLQRPRAPLHLGPAGLDAPLRQGARPTG